MNVRSAKCEVRSAKWVVGVWSVICAVFRAAAADQRDEIPPLAPAHGELPPSFWEQHGLLVVLGGILLLALAGLAAWWLWWRPRPTVVIPPEVEARRELESLRPGAPDGAILSRISRCLRRYFAAAFRLPPEELTTSEFCRAAEASETIGPALAAQAGEFLRRCDELKFSPADALPPAGAVAQALELIQLGETRRAQLHQSETAAASPRTGSA